MLRNVLGDYLDEVHERDFDLPLLAFLPTLGFYDIHYTHGQVEFGKDVIAKRVEAGTAIQYSFQSKAGDISQGDWRDGIMGQMLEAVMTGLSHPNFDRGLPYQSILVVTGRLLGNAALGLQDLNATIQNKYGKRSIIVWDHEVLLGHLETAGLEGVYRATALGFVGYGSFFILYGKCTEGNISDREVERHFRRWLDGTVSPSMCLLAATIEAEILAQKCVQQGLLYEAIQIYLAATRTLLFQARTEESAARRIELIELDGRMKLRLHAMCALYLNEIRQNWQASKQDLVRVVTSPGAIFTYLVQCARIMETAGALYFLESDQATRQTILEFIDDFALREPGCAHIPSDRWAVSLVLPVLALCSGRRHERAVEILHRATVWLCDRVQHGDGIASIESDPITEVTQLLGHPFSFIPQPPASASLLATVICDLAAFLGNEQLYSDVVNDIKACNISPEYWQTPDDENLFRIDGPEVITYPNVEPKDNVTRFEDYDYAEHIVHEPRRYQLAELVGPFSLMSIMLLLRDRYFPTVWPSLVSP
jgi:hypothetical protein